MGKGCKGIELEERTQIQRGSYKEGDRERETEEDRQRDRERERQRETKRGREIA